MHACNLCQCFNGLFIFHSSHAFRIFSLSNRLIYAIYFLHKIYLCSPTLTLASSRASPVCCGSCYVQSEGQANGLPCSNQLSYRVIQRHSGWVWVLKAWSARDPAEADEAAMFDREGVGSAKHEAQAGAGPMGPYSQHHSHHCRPLSPVVSPLNNVRY